MPENPRAQRADGRPLLLPVALRAEVAEWFIRTRGFDELLVEAAVAEAVEILTRNVLSCPGLRARAWARNRMVLLVGRLLSRADAASRLGPRVHTILYGRHFEEVVTSLERGHHASDDARDAAQDAWLNVSHAYPDLCSAENFRRLWYVSARNLATTRARRLRFHDTVLIPKIGTTAVVADHADRLATSISDAVICEPLLSLALAHLENDKCVTTRVWAAWLCREAREEHIANLTEDKMFWILVEAIAANRELAAELPPITRPMWYRYLRRRGLSRPDARLAANACSEGATSSVGARELALTPAAVRQRVRRLRLGNPWLGELTGHPRR
jgi:DNA-directed RNA polymerase specialized sigma24 family protein